MLNHSDPTTTTKDTPKKVTIADVNFFRTKTGNLVRASAIQGPNGYCAASTSKVTDQGSLIRPRAIHRKQKAQCKTFSLTGTLLSPRSSVGFFRSRKHHAWRRRLGKIPCSSLTNSTGKCPFGPSCKFAHNPDKVAACKDFLRTGTCVAGQFCDLSHDLTYHRVPACTHFLRGNCVNDACRYPHIHVSLAALVCRSFATLGYCARGEECAKRHVSECPDYANHGYCEGRESGKCSLPHPDRASTLRKAAARSAKVGSENESDVSSDQDGSDGDVGFEDVDSDEAEDVIMGGDGYQHELTQQNDYIAFSK